jgi:hypothetical protein
MKTSGELKRVQGFAGAVAGAGFIGSITIDSSIVKTYMIIAIIIKIAATMILQSWWSFFFLGARYVEWELIR